MGFGRLYPVGASDVLWLHGNKDYLFGFQSGSNPTNAKIWRKSVTGDAAVVADFSADNLVIQNIIAFDDIVFADIRDSDSLHYLYRSYDNGLTWQHSHKIGEYGGTHYSNVSILGSRGMCRHVIDDVVKFYYGDYNTRAESGGAIDGSVKVYESSDLGQTWTSIFEWNTDASFYVTHCHLVTVDPFTNFVYIGLGDGTNSGIVQWDGVTDVTSSWNKLPASMNGDAGLKAFGGHKKYQCTDLLFYPNHVVNPADNLNTTGANDGAQGIWKFDRDFSYYINTAAPNAQFANHNLYWAVELQGKSFACEIINPSAAGQNKLLSYIYGNDGSPDNWKIVGKIILTNTTSGGGPKGFFVWNNQVVFSWNDFAGRGNWSYFYELRGDIVNYAKNGDPIPEVLAPIAWVATNGIDATANNQGFLPTAPWASVKYACASNNFVQGGRILVGAGEFLSDSINPGFSTIGAAGLAFGNTKGVPTVIEGQGMGSTRLALSSDSADTTFIQVDADSAVDGNGNYPGNHSLRFVNIHIDSDKSNTIIIDTDNSADAFFDAYFTRFGDRSRTQTRNIRYYGTTQLYLYQCFVDKDAAAAGVGILPSATNGGVCLIGGVVRGGDYGLRNSFAGATIQAFGTVFIDYLSAALNEFSSADQEIEAVGCIGIAGAVNADFIQHPIGLTTNRKSHHNVITEDMYNSAIVTFHPAVNAYSAYTPADIITDYTTLDFTPLINLPGAHSKMPTDYAGTKSQAPCQIGNTAYPYNFRKTAGSRASAGRS